MKGALRAHIIWLLPMVVWKRYFDYFLDIVGVESSYAAAYCVEAKEVRHRKGFLWRDWTG